MANLFADLQAVYVLVAGQATMWIIAGSVGALFGLAALTAALRLVRRLV